MVTRFSAKEEYKTMPHIAYEMLILVSLLAGVVFLIYKNKNKKWKKETLNMLCDN